MGLVTLIELSPRRPADGVVELQRFCHNSRASARFLSQQWLPEVESLPEFEVDLGFDGRLYGQAATPSVGQIRLRTPQALAAMVWKGAAGTMRTAPLPLGAGDPADGDFSAPMPFRVASAAWADGILTLTLMDSGEPLRRTVISLRYGSSGIALLDGADTADLHGRPVATGWGRLFSVPCRLVDRANNIWLALGRPSASIQGIFDGGAAFSAGVARASLAALQANTPADGAADWCLDAGGLTLIRPWTEPAFPLTVDLTAAGATLPGAIINGIISARGGPSRAAGTVAAFDALYPFTSGLFAEDEQTIAQALDRIVSGLGGWWKVNSAGSLVLGRMALAAPAATFEALSVASAERVQLVMPTRRRGVGWARNNRVHGEGEIAAILLADLVGGLGDLATADTVDFTTQVVGTGKPQAGATRNVFRGVHTTAIAYDAGDEVSTAANDQIYVALIDVPVGIALSNTTHWQLKIEAGGGAPGVNGTRTAVLDVYRWSAAAPTTFPSGDSTYTWATGQFTAPATLNGWALVPGAPVPGQTLWSLRQVFADNNTTPTSIVSWTVNSPQPISRAGDNGTPGANGFRFGLLELYRWSATAPTTFPSGTSTYTWADGTFTLPVTPNGWSLTPGAAVPGQTLWGISVVIADQLTTPTSTRAWDSSTVYPVGYAGDDGADGGDGDPALYFSQLPASVQVRLSSAGVPRAGELPRTIQMRLWKQGVDVTASATFAFTATGCGITNLGGGQWRLDTLIDQSAEVEVSASLEGDSITVTVAVVGVPEGRPGNLIADDTLTVNNTGAYLGEQGGPLTLTVGDRPIRIEVVHGYSVATLSAVLTGKVQYRTTPGAGPWIDVGAAEVGTLAIVGEPGSLLFERVLSGPSVNANWEFRYQNFRSSGTGTASSLAGSQLFQVSQ